MPYILTKQSAKSLAAGCFQVQICCLSSGFGRGLHVLSHCLIRPFDLTHSSSCVKILRVLVSFSTQASNLKYLIWTNCRYENRALRQMFIGSELERGQLEWKTQALESRCPDSFLNMLGFQSNWKQVFWCLSEFKGYLALSFIYYLRF